MTLSSACEQGAYIMRFQCGVGRSRWQGVRAVHAVCSQSKDYVLYGNTSSRFCDIQDELISVCIGSEILTKFEIVSTTSDEVQARAKISKFSQLSHLDSLMSEPPSRATICPCASDGPNGRVPGPEFFHGPFNLWSELQLERYGRGPGIQKVNEEQFDYMLQRRPNRKILEFDMELARLKAFVHPSVGLLL